MNQSFRVGCPTCRQRGEWFAGPFGPFCSRRCRLIDLGEWLGEEHLIGGPLRPDQIRDLAQFILNWESTATGEVVIEALPTPTLRPEDLNDPVARGQQVFLNRGCTGCHTVEGLSTATIGPNLTTIGTVAATRVPGQSAEEYIRESILNPSTHIVEGFQDNIMPKNFGELIPAAELDDLVASLLARQ